MKSPIWLTDDPNDFPPLEMALDDPEGLLAIGGDLSPTRLLAGYRHGIFPWYNEDQPILWWSPNPRTILEFDKFHVSKSLQKILNQNRFEVFFDRNFEQVVEACQKPRTNQIGTWISDDMKAAYNKLFEMGYAHCIEVEHEGALFGGLYGVSLGRAFFGESMFSSQDNGSKIALYFLIEKLRSWGFTWLDCQVWSDHLGTLGSIEISRQNFIERLNKALAFETVQGPWTV